MVPPTCGGRSGSFPSSPASPAGSTHAGRAGQRCRGWSRGRSSRRGRRRARWRRPRSRRPRARLVARSERGSRGATTPTSVPFDQYHEPPGELPEATRTFARMCASLIEESEAIGWYEQRLAVERDAQARAIMENAQLEEFKHFGMDLEFLLRRKPK